jgi:hypothetical protein
MIDIMDKTENWKTLLKILGFVVFSYILGIALIKVFEFNYGFPINSSLSIWHIIAILKY